MLSLYILYKLKLASYNLRILVESSLIVVLAIKLNFELRATFNEDCSLVNAYCKGLRSRSYRTSILRLYSIEKRTIEA
jgi:hypothetical protein